MRGIAMQKLGLHDVFAIAYFTAKQNNILTEAKIEKNFLKRFHKVHERENGRSVR